MPDPESWLTGKKVYIPLISKEVHRLFIFLAGAGKSLLRMAFPSFSSINPQTYPQLLGARAKNVVIATTWRIFPEMTGEKHTNSQPRSHPGQTGVLLDFSQLLRVSKRVWARNHHVWSAIARQASYAQVGSVGGIKILSSPLTSSFFSKLLIKKEFSGCHRKRQSQLFQWGEGFSRVFHVAIHRIIHSFWGQAEKTLFPETVSEALHPSVLGR